MFKQPFFLLLFFWTTTTVFAQPTIKWRFNTKDASFGQSAAGDIDGDGKLEIVFGCYRNDSMIYALNAEDGSLLWKFNAKGSAEGCNDVAPVIYDVDGDGRLDVVVPSSCNPKTFCFDGKTGAVKWVCNTRGSDSPPTITDMDGDGKPEILHGEFGGYVICINAENGTVAWELPVDTKSWIQTAPTIVDVDRNGELDFVVGTWNNNKLSDNKIYAYRAKDQKPLWSFSVGNFIYHGTAVGDLDKDGKPELVVGCYNDTLYCLNAEDGSLNWKYCAGPSYYVGAPAVIADLDNNGSCEVVFSAWSAILALKSDGSLMWRYNVPDYKQAFRGVAVADINYNNVKDVIFGTDGGSLIGLNGNDGSLIFNKNLRADYGDSLFNIDNAPLIADFDKDGKLDAFIIGGHAEYPDFNKNFGRAYMLTLAKGNGPDWLMFQNDIWRQSSLCQMKSVSVNEYTTRNDELTIFPNPSSGEVSLEIATDNAAETIVELYSIQGKKIDGGFTEKLIPGKNTLHWNLNNKPSPGFYYFVISISGKRMIKSIVFE